MAQNATESKPGRRRGYGFGTFQGVFTPSILTILGVIMYLRFGWVLGNLGLMGTLLVVTLANAITFLTGLSLAALATNRRVGGGGAYYIISRSLGLETGAAVGLPLYFAQSLGISFYLAGFAEAVGAVVPGLDPRVTGMATLVVLAGLVYLSADLALKTQFLVLAVIVASLVSVFAGGDLELSAGPAAALPAALPFWAVFAVFFPAVTGIEAGIAMSGDLKDPARSLPRGTIAAVLTGFVVYLAIPIFLYARVPDTGRLLAEPFVLREVARWPAWVVAGVWCAALSSAMGSMLGAPRTLQALARDHVVPRWIGRGYGAGGDPRNAVLITFAVAGAGVLLGDLNAIAPILSMFFLTSYGLLNISAGFASLINAASWRPTFRVRGSLSLLGAAACFSVMFMINAGATLLAILVSLGVYTLMKRRRLRVRWGDMKYGILMVAAQQILYRLAALRPNRLTWTPNILVFSGSPTRRWYLIEMANAITRGRSLMTLATVVPEASWSAERQDAVRDTILAYLARRGVRALVKIVPGDDPLQAALELVTGYGFGPLAPNTVLLGETERPEQFATFARLTRRIYRSRRNLVIVRESDTRQEAPKALHTGTRIDIWWRGQPQNVGLMITLAYLIRQSPGWQEAHLKIKQIVDAAAEEESARRRLEAYLKEQRLDADVEVHVKETTDVFAMIRRLSAGADLVFFGLRAPQEDESPASYATSYKILLRNTSGLPAVAFVLAGQDIPFYRMYDDA
jgi:solute carrier family 12 (sodium/potassium/chloride transporter), member 2